MEPLAAPVLGGERFGGQPVYFSDVVVRRDSPFHSFAELRGRTWCYNETQSQSGYGITRYHLVQLGETAGFFGEVIETGWHEKSLRLVCSGEVDAGGLIRGSGHCPANQPEVAAELRILDSLGPSTIQPIVVCAGFVRVRADLQAVLVKMHQHDLAETLGPRFRGTVRPSRTVITMTSVRCKAHPRRPISWSCVEAVHGVTRSPAWTATLLSAILMESVGSAALASG